MERYQDELEKAVKHLHIADHITYVTFPLLNDHRLLLKIFDEIYSSIIACISSVLYYESMYKRIQLYHGFNDNFESFVKVSRHYDLSNEQVKMIREAIALHKRHKYSAMEFVKREKVIIMSDSLGIEVVDIIAIKKHLLLAKELLVKVKKRFS